MRLWQSQPNVSFVLIRSNVAFTIGNMTQGDTVVSTLGIRHRTTGWSKDARGRYVDLTACGRTVLITVQESEDTVDCPLCFAPAPERRPRKRSVRSTP